jgi:hypothetical protein
MRPLLIVALALSATAANAIPMFVDGNGLLDQCEKKYSDFCHGYLAGIADALATESGVVYPEFTICLPDKTNTRQLVDVVMKGLKDNPQDRTYTAASVASEYLRKAWPCKANLKP